MHEGKYKYQITKQKLIEYIKELPPDTPLPNRNVLAKQCGVARVTLERAISELIGEGILISEDGCGTFAAQKRADSASGKGIWALLIYSVLDGMNPGIIRAAEDFAYAHDRSLIICNTDNDPQKESEYLKRMLNQNVEGVLLIPNTYSVVDTEVLEHYKEKKIPLVTCGRQVPGYDFPGTFQNFFMTGFLAAQHLLQVGCRRIAYLADSKYSTIEARLQGYLTALEQHDYQNRDRHTNEAAVGMTDLHGNTEEAIERFLVEHSEIDGIYVFTDRLAMSLYHVMKKRGLTPGKEICVISGDASEYCNVFSTALSTVDCPAYKMGASAAEQLYALVHNTLEISEYHRMLSCELNPRESTLGATK